MTQSQEHPADIAANMLASIRTMQTALNELSFQAEELSKDDSHKQIAEVVAENARLKSENERLRQTVVQKSRGAEHYLGEGK